MSVALLVIGGLLVSTPPPREQIATVPGVCRGNTIRARHLSNDLMAVFRSVVGGEITEYTKMMAESREQTLDRTRADAVARGANAVLGARFTTSMVMSGSSEILSYGTAVILAPIVTD